MALPNINKIAVLILPFALITNASAVSIGIIDSGTDLKHPWLAAKAWINPSDKAGDRIDNDSNGYVDDVNGWNFAENNNQIIDYKYLGKFSPDVKKFFEVQVRVIDGTATEADKAWLSEKRQDQDFIRELTTFGNFAHGTHVAGITAQDAGQARIMAAKIIPTEVKMPGAQGVGALQRLRKSVSGLQVLSGFMDDFLMQGALGMIAGQQTKSLAAVGEYVNKTKMRVANCSFGVGSAQARTIVQMIATNILKRDLSEEETDKYTVYFLKQLNEKGSVFVTSASQTLFVMAAGNDGSDNDQLPVFPANLKYDNTITVAATRRFDRLASFSNYGQRNVDIAAPGVGIISSIPGTDTMAMSGTSQAAPFIANLAGRILDVNSKLTLPQVKEIMMKTVDKKDFLMGKVTSGGVANPMRALEAATLSLTRSLPEAIKQAIQTVETNDAMILGLDALETDTGFDGIPMSLTPLFAF